MIRNITGFARDSYKPSFFTEVISSRLEGPNLCRKTVEYDSFQASAGWLFTKKRNAEDIIF